MHLERQPAHGHARKYLFELVVVAFHLIAAVIWYLFIPWPWEEFQKAFGNSFCRACDHVLDLAFHLVDDIW